MPAKNPKDLFVMMLSNVRNAVQRETSIYQEMMQIVQDPDIKEALEARIFLTDKQLGAIDECFRMISEQPMKTTGKIQEAWLEDFRKELSEIQSPVLKHLFVLSKAIHLTHLRVGEYIALVAAADMTGDYGVGMLLESCLADKLAFVERTRRLIRHAIETRAGSKLVA